MRVLVTGAAGFLGYAVAALLVEHGHEVTGLTRSQASALPTGVQRPHGDLRTPQTLPTALAEVDGVCHLAGLTKVRESRSNPVEYWRTNVGGPLTILDRLTDARGGRIVVASTCAVYGQQAEHPISETAPVAPSSPYATSTLAADQAAADLAATGAIGAISLRAVTVAGALPGHPDPDTTAFVLALHACQPGRWRAYNLGSGHPSTVHDVIAAVETVTGRPIPRRHTATAHEPATLLADSTRIHSELGWRPHKSSLTEIITDAWTALNSD